MTYGEIFWAAGKYAGKNALMDAVGGSIAGSHPTPYTLNPEPYTLNPKP